MAGINVNTTTIAVPTELSNTIIKKVQESSAVMALANSIELPGLGLTIPIITSDPEAEWVAETGKKPVSRPGLATKVMQAYTLAVIVPFSNQFKNNLPGLYNAIVERLPKALAKKFIFENEGETEDGNFIIRFCTSWATKEEAVDALIETIEKL